MTVIPQSASRWPTVSLRAGLDWATASHQRVVAMLVLVSLLALLPGFFTIPPTDRDESRFAQATKQMIESGDVVDIRFQNDVRYKKPVGIYWLQAGVVHAAEAVGVPEARTRIWLYRIPSLIGALGAVLLTYWTALAFGTRRTAALAALMMASCVLLSVEARIAKTDAMLILTIVAAMGALARAYLRPEDAQQSPWSLPVIFWTALASGILLKGPLIAMVVGLAVVALAIRDRTIRWFAALRPGLGLLWTAILVLPWFVAIVLKAGDSFFVESVGQDMLSKVVSGQESHGAPPGTYLALFWVTFWPASGLALAAVPAVWAERKSAVTFFLLAWLIPSWLVFELVPTKLPHYVLPLYPALAILIACAIERHALSSNKHLVRANWLWPIVAIVVPIAGVVGVVIMRQQLGLIAWPFAGVAMVIALWAWRHYRTDGPETSLLRAMLAAVLVYIAVFGALIPLLRPMFPAVALARVLQDAPCPNPQAASAGYHEPSLVFLAGTSTVLTEGAGAAEFLRGGACRYAFVEARQERAFVQRVEANGTRYARVGTVTGRNINGFRDLTFGIYRAEGGP